MINNIHLAAIFFGFVSYYFSDVNSSSGFFNLFLPLIVLLSFIYGLLVTINLIVKSRRSRDYEDKSVDFLLENMKAVKNDNEEETETEIETDSVDVKNKPE